MGQTNLEMSLPPAVAASVISPPMQTIAPRHLSLADEFGNSPRWRPHTLQEARKGTKPFSRSRLAVEILATTPPASMLSLDGVGPLPVEPRKDIANARRLRLQPRGDVSRLAEECRIQLGHVRLLFGQVAITHKIIRKGLGLRRWPSNRIEPHFVNNRLTPTFAAERDMGDVDVPHPAARKRSGFGGAWLHRTG